MLLFLYSFRFLPVHSNALSATVFIVMIVSTRFVPSFGVDSKLIKHKINL